MKIMKDTLRGGLTQAHAVQQLMDPLYIKRLASQQQAIKYMYIFVILFHVSVNIFNIQK